MWCITIKITEYFPKSFFAEQVNRFSFLLLLLPLPRYHSRGCVMLLCVCMCTCVCVCVCWCVWRALDRDEPRGSTSTIRNISACSTCLPASWLTDWLTDWLHKPAACGVPLIVTAKTPPKYMRKSSVWVQRLFMVPSFFFFMLWNLTTSDNTVPFE